MSMEISSNIYTAIKFIPILHIGVKIKIKWDGKTLLY